MSEASGLAFRATSGRHTPHSTTFALAGGLPGSQTQQPGWREKRRRISGTDRGWRRALRCPQTGPSAPTRGPRRRRIFGASWVREGPDSASSPVSPDLHPTGGVMITLGSAEGETLWASELHSFGVNGKWVPGCAADRLVAWEETVRTLSFCSIWKDKWKCGPRWRGMWLRR